MAFITFFYWKNLIIEIFKNVIIMTDAFPILPWVKKIIKYYFLIFPLLELPSLWSKNYGKNLN